MTARSLFVWGLWIIYCSSLVSIRTHCCWIIIDYLIFNALNNKFSIYLHWIGMREEVSGPDILKPQHIKLKLSAWLDTTRGTERMCKMCKMYKLNYLITRQQDLMKEQELHYCICLEVSSTVGKHSTKQHRCPDRHWRPKPTVFSMFSLTAWHNSMTSTDTVNYTWIISLALILSPLPRCVQQQFVTATCWASQGFSVLGQKALTQAGGV